jgi:NDP-hexose 4-ketoreductase
MPVVGHGFLAHHLEPVARTHRDVLFFAAGVSRSTCRDDAAFARECALLSQSICTARENGWTMVYLSTISISRSDSPDGVDEEAAPQPRTPYGAHKRAMERMVREETDQHLILRLSNPVGAGQQPWQLVPSLAMQVAAGCVTVWNGAMRDIIDVHDVTALTGLLLAAGVTNQIVNVASGASVSVDSLVDHLCTRLGRVAQRIYVAGDDVQRVCIDKLRGLVGDLSSFGFDGDYFRRVIDRYY